MYMKNTIIVTVTARAFIINPLMPTVQQQLENKMRVLANCIIDRILLDHKNKQLKI